VDVVIVGFDAAANGTVTLAAGAVTLALTASLVPFVPPPRGDDKG